MKRFYLVLLALISLSASVFADGLTATLQQGDVMTPFYGVDAFKNAYAAAKDGAVITLSPGNFNAVSKVEKQITVIGAYAFGSNSSEQTLLGSIHIEADNVKIEGVNFNDVHLGINSVNSIMKNFTLKKCYVTNLVGDFKHENTIVDQCCIQTEAAISKSLNYCIKNSTIGFFSEMNSRTNIAYIANCVVWNWAVFYSTGNYAQSKDFCEPYAVYKNNYLGISKPNNLSFRVYLYSPSEFYNNRFFSSYKTPIYLFSVEFNYGNGCVNEGNIKDENLKFNKLNEYPAHPIDAPLGSDGTPIGPYGGTGFSEYPAIPRITSKTIDANSDAEGKINVKITVKAE